MVTWDRVAAVEGARNGQILGSSEVTVTGLPDRVLVGHEREEAKVTH